MECGDSSPLLPPALELSFSWEALRRHRPSVQPIWCGVGDFYLMNARFQMTFHHRHVVSARMSLTETFLLRRAFDKDLNRASYPSLVSLMAHFLG